MTAFAENPNLSLTRLVRAVPAEMAGLHASVRAMLSLFSTFLTTAIFFRVFTLAFFVADLLARVAAREFLPTKLAAGRS